MSPRYSQILFDNEEFAGSIDPDWHFKAQVYKAHPTGQRKSELLLLFGAKKKIKQNVYFNPNQYGLAIVQNPELRLPSFCGKTVYVRKSAVEIIM